MNKTYIGFCVQDLEKLLHAATLENWNFYTLICDTCSQHRPDDTCWECLTLHKGRKGAQMKRCPKHSHNPDCDHCIQKRWDSQEQCRIVITKTFASVLHHSLKEVYSTRSPLPAIDFPYPGIVTHFTLEQLMASKDHCESFLESLWAVKGHQDGSVFFYQYGCKKRAYRTPFDFIEGLSWQLILPYGLASALIANPRLMTPRSGVFNVNPLCR